MKTQTQRSCEERILRVLVHIQGHLDHALDLDQLASLAHFSPYHFHRIFRGMVGEPVGEHIRRLRLERAAYRLKSSSQPITQVAFEAGYETHEAFTRAFRAMFGQSPSGFREIHRRVPVGGVPSGVHYVPDGKLDGFQPLQTEGAAMEARIEAVKPMRLKRFQGFSGGCHWQLAASAAEHGRTSRPWHPTVSETALAFMRHLGPYDQVGATWEESMAWAGRRGLLGPGGKAPAIPHDDPEVAPPDKLRYDACIVVDDRFEPEGEVGVQEIAGGEYAVTTHRGPYQRLGETYAALLGQWLPAYGREPLAGPGFEAYRNNPHTTAPDELLTDIYVSLQTTQTAAEVND